MGGKGGLAASEKAVISSQLAERKTTLEISKKIGRHHPVKNFVKDPTKVRKRADKGKSRVIARRSLSRIEREIVRILRLISGELFKPIGGTTVSRTTMCRILKRITKPLMPIINPLLSKTFVYGRNPCYS